MKFPPPTTGGSESIDLSYPPTVARESTTVKKHEAQRKTDTKWRGEKEESRERKRFNSQDSEHSTKREAVSSTTIMMRNDTLVLSRRQ